MLSEKWKLIKNDFPGYKDEKNNTFLIEDMFQATANNFTIDSGWYGDEHGCFITFLIKDSNWEEPFIKIVSDTISNVEWAILACQEYALRF